MADSIFGTSYPKDYDPSINVTQYGWDEFDTAGVDLIQDYIKQAQVLKDECQKIYEEIQLTLQNIPYIREAYGYIQTAYEDFKIKYPDFDTKYQDFLTKYQETLGAQQEVSQNANIVRADKQAVEALKLQIDAIKVQIDASLTTIQGLVSQASTYRDQALSYRDSAAASAKEATDAAEELKKGQVYRGLWNPEALNAYPPKPTTNSYWDVTLNDGSTSHVFDGKTWKQGQRLIFTLTTDMFEQGPGLQTGVTSFNGREGAVIPAPGDYSASAVGADPVGTAESVSTAKITALKAEDNPFPAYLKESTLPAKAVTSFNGKVGAVVGEDVWVEITSALRDTLLTATGRVRFLADTTGGAHEITIGPNVTELLIKDVSGTAKVNPVKINPPSGITINGNTFEDLDDNFGYVHYIKSGSKFITIGGL